MCCSNKIRVFLFGESEKGDYCTPFRFDSLLALSDTLGHPPENSIGIDYAIQTLLFEHELIFYRVKEEGFAKEDYLRGINLLNNHGKNLGLTAICAPGVGDQHIVESLAQVGQKLRCILVLSERDLYDYLTASKY